MVTAATNTTLHRRAIEPDWSGELTLDALLARMRSAAEAHMSPQLSERIATNRHTNGEADDAAALLKAQIEFNQAIVSAVNSIAQFLKQPGFADRPPAGNQSAIAELHSRIDGLAANVSELTQRLDQSAAFNAADQNQREITAELGNRLDSLEQRAPAIEQFATAQAAELRDQITSGQTANNQLCSEFRAISQRTAAQVAEIELRLFRAERNLRTKAKAATTNNLGHLVTTRNQDFVGAGGAPTPEPADELAPSLAAEISDTPFDYFLFEHRFRGPTDEIKRRQQAYLDFFSSADCVLDLGCGRGEFVELLVERGIPTIGVDLSQDMVDFCRARGLPVLHGDLFQYLAAQPDESLGGIFISQVVEHLSADDVWKLIQLATAKLKTAGVLLLETINPQCFAAISCFYLDPSHVRPYHAGLLAFMCEQARLDLQCIQFSAPLPSQAADRVLKSAEKIPPPEAGNYQDYAVIARRSPVPLDFP